MKTEKTNKELHRVKFPITDNLSYNQLYFIKIKQWFDQEKLIYFIDYYFEWCDTGKFVPTYLWVTDDLAILLSLKFAN